MSKRRSHRWTIPERAALAYQLERPESYVLKPGYSVGHRNYELIAKRLNEQYHNGELIRDESSVKSQCNALRNMLPGYKPRSS